jgi:glycosyltransferase involved in cell wall biosynthesis
VDYDDARALDAKARAELPALLAMIIGHLRPNYAERRNIIGIVRPFEYRELPDTSRHLAHRARQLNTFFRHELFPINDVENLYYARPRPRPDLLHLINAVSLAPVPWVSTFETIIPRFRVTLAKIGSHPPVGVTHASPWLRLALRALRSRNCKKLIAMSETTATIQADFLAALPGAAEAILPKLVVLHPPQRRELNSMEDKPKLVSKQIKFMFVGGAFFRKGGREILDAFHYLRQVENLTNLHLTIVSSLRIDNYASGETEHDVARAKDFISANRHWITHHASLPNAEVISLMRGADVGMLPTYADTYGYSMLEFQACGCPVVSTAIRALREINGSDVGWLIEVPINRYGEASHTNHPERKELSSRIRQGIISIVRDIAKDPTVVRAKGANALNRVFLAHDPATYASRLRELYVT